MLIIEIALGIVLGFAVLSYIGDIIKATLAIVGIIATIFICSYVYYETPRAVLIVWAISFIIVAILITPRDKKESESLATPDIFEVPIEKETVYKNK